MTFSQELLFWYDRHKRSMPWRGEIDPYKIWLSEVMLQQTQVKTVIPYYHRWLKRFPTIRHVSKASQDEILKSWEGLGYYSRGVNFHEACKQVVSQYNGKIPDEAHEFSQLKGVGPYTTAAVLSIAFNKKIPVIDGNVKRVMARVGGIKDPPSKVLYYVEVLLKARMLDCKRPGDFNQAMMDLGATICAKVPKCYLCPISKRCFAFQTSRVHLYPVSEKKRDRPHYRIAVGIICHKDKVLIGKRKLKGLLGGLWEFPGGKIQKGETEKECVKREIKEEVNVEVDVEKSVGVIKHAYTHFSIEMEGFLCRYLKGRPKALGCSEVRWIKWNEFSKYPFPKANHKLFPLLAKVFPIL